MYFGAAHLLQFHIESHAHAQLLTREIAFAHPTDQSQEVANHPHCRIQFSLFNSAAFTEQNITKVLCCCLLLRQPLLKLNARKLLLS